MDKPSITIAVVIPSWSGAAQATLDSVEQQSWQADEIEVAIGISPNGRARNVGVAGVSAEFIVFVDDDAILATPETIENLVRPLVEDPTVHITGASKLIPPDAPWFQKWVAREVPRIEHPILDKPLITNPDPPTYSTEITTTCCAMRRTDYERVGGFSETLVRGVDTEFFVRARREGCNFMLVPNTWTWHPAPSNLRKLWRKHFLYGMGHAGEIQADPARAEGLQKYPFAYLLFRTMILVPNIFIPFSYNARSWRPGFKPLKATTSYVGALGYFLGSVRGQSTRGG